MNRASLVIESPRFVAKVNHRSGPAPISSQAPSRAMRNPSWAVDGCSWTCLPGLPAKFVCSADGGLRRHNRRRICRRLRGAQPTLRKKAAPLGAAFVDIQAALESGQHFVLLEPAHQLAPRLLGLRLAVAQSVIGVEAVRGAVIDVEFGGLARGLEPRFHVLDLLGLDAAVLGAIEAEHRLLDLGD